MKQIITTAALALGSLSTITAQTNATNWTALDCNSTNHTLFTDLDNGKIVVMVWVMPCGSCINGAKAAYNAAQSFAATNPGKVVYYLADDIGDATCTDLTTWINTNSIGSLSNMTIFSNAGNVIKETDFGGPGMPHVTVMGGTDHKIYYNKMNSATNDQPGITSAISTAITATNVNTVARNAVFTVLPNPASDKITINYNNPIREIEVTALNGTVVKKEVFEKGAMNPTIKLNGLANGVFMVKIYDMNGNAGIQKIVKE